MSYRRNTLLNRRLPTFMGALVLLATLTITIVLSRNTMLYVTKATVGSVPKDLQITTLSDSSFTVTFDTDETAIGTLSYGTTPTEGQIALDTRDTQTAKPSEYRTHTISVSNLTPGTKYYFTITSGNQTGTNNGSPYEVTTPAALTNEPVANGQLAGTAALDDGSFPAEGIVTVSSSDSQTVSGIVSSDGTYVLPLTKLRSADFQKYIVLQPQTQLHMTIHTISGDTKVAITTEQAHAVPKIVLSKNYDFTIGPDPLNDNSVSDTASQAGSFPPADNSTLPVSSPEIIVPKIDQRFKDLQPKFQGKALPNADIEITIQSQKEITAKIQSDANGVWEFRPPITLDPGAHTITVTSVDTAGLMQKITRSFVVNAQGSQFIEPSISPPIPTAITPQPSALPASTPTGAPTIAPSTTPQPSLSPTAEIIVKPTTIMHPTGSNTFVHGIIGAIAAIGIGTLLFVFTAL